MSLSHEHIGLKILAKIKIYIPTRAELLFPLCYEIPCTIVVYYQICTISKKQYIYVQEISREIKRSFNLENIKEARSLSR